MEILFDNFSLIISTFISFFICNSPLFTVLLVFFYFVSLIIYMSIMVESSFFCFLLFLVFVTGLITLFMYICSIVNEGENVQYNSSSDQVTFYWVSSYFFDEDFDLLALAGDLFDYSDCLNLVKSYMFSGFEIWASLCVWLLFMSFIIVCNLLKNISGPLRCFNSKDI